MNEDSFACSYFDLHCPWFVKLLLVAQRFYNNLKRKSYFKVLWGFFKYRTEQQVLHGRRGEDVYLNRCSTDISRSKI